MLDSEGSFKERFFIHSLFNKYLPITYYVPDLTGGSNPGPALIMISMVTGDAPYAGGGLREGSLENEMEKAFQQRL